MKMTTIKEPEVREVRETAVLLVNEYVIVREAVWDPWSGEAAISNRHHLIGIYSIDNQADIQNFANSYIDQRFSERGPVLQQSDLDEMRQALEEAGFIALTP